MKSIAAVERSSKPCLLPALSVRCKLGRTFSSDLRLMIAGSFAEQGIVIDYPQRDIHLHTTRPIPVAVVPTKNLPPAQDGLPKGIE